LARRHRALTALARPVRSADSWRAWGGTSSSAVDPGSAGNRRSGGGAGARTRSREPTYEVGTAALLASCSRRGRLHYDVLAFPAGRILASQPAPARDEPVWFGSAAMGALLTVRDAGKSGPPPEGLMDRAAEPRQLGRAHPAHRIGGSARRATPNLLRLPDRLTFARGTLD